MHFKTFKMRAVDREDSGLDIEELFFGLGEDDLANLPSWVTDAWNPHSKT